jgi:hypothetical protein
MKITVEIDAEMDELVPLVRMILMGQITEADLSKAKQREATYTMAASNARVSKLFVEAHDRERRNHLPKDQD